MTRASGCIRARRPPSREAPQSLRQAWKEMNAHRVRLPALAGGPAR